MIDPQVLKMMGAIRDMGFHGDFIVFGKRKKSRIRADPYYKAGISARRRRTKLCREKH